MIDATDYTPEELLTIVEHRAWRCREIAESTASEGTRLEAERHAARYEEHAARLRVVIARQGLRVVDCDPDA